MAVVVNKQPVAHKVAGRRTPKRSVPVVILAGLAWTGILFGALDYGSGSSILCLVASVVMVVQLWTDSPSGRFWRSIAPVAILTALALGWAAFASAMSGVTALVPDLAVHELVGSVGYAVILLIAATAGYAGSKMKTMLDWMLIFGTIDLAAGLLLRATRNDPLFAFWELSRSERFLGTVNNANASAALCGVVVTLALGRLLSGRILSLGRVQLGRLPTMVVCGASIVIAILGLVLTASRTGFVLTCLASGLLTILALRAEKAVERRRIMLAAGATAILIITVIGSTVSERLFDRFGRFEQGSLDRQAMWSHYADLAFQSPWTGYGLGSFPVMNARYLSNIETAKEMWMVNSPHNIVLHLMLGAGLPYLLLIVTAGLLIMRPVIGVVWRERGVGDTRLAMIAATVLLGSSMVDLALEMPAIAALFLAFIGVAWGEALRAARAV